MPQSLPGSEKGISAIEILVVVFIIGLALSSLLGLTSFSLNAATLTKQMFEADNLAQEAMEQARSFRDLTDWDSEGLGSLLPGSDYHAERSQTPPVWSMALGEESIGMFVRKIVLAEVRRDGSDNIVESGGSVDPDTLKVTATVEWEDKGSHKVELTTYLTNWR